MTPNVIPWQVLGAMGKGWAMRSRPLKVSAKAVVSAAFLGSAVLAGTAAPAVSLGRSLDLPDDPTVLTSEPSVAAAVDGSTPAAAPAVAQAADTQPSGPDAAGVMLGDVCDNGANASGCTVQKQPGWEIPPQLWALLPSDTRSFLLDVNRRRPATWWEISPINHDGSASCVSGDNTHTCGYYGMAPIAGAGSANCSTYQGCGYWGTGPIAVGGDNTCSGIQSNNSWGCGVSSTPQTAVGGSASCNMVTPNGRGCGFLGTGPVAIGGSTTCATVRGCGWLSTGPIAVGGSASCSSTSTGCGYWGTGPVSPTGDVSCTGTCGKSGTLGDACTLFGLSCGSAGTTVSPRTGTPGVTVTGQATCGNEFNRSLATNQAHLQSFECVSVVEAVGAPPAIVPSCATGGTPPSSVTVTCRVDPAPAPPCLYVAYTGGIATSADPQSCIPGP